MASLQKESQNYVVELKKDSSAKNVKWYQFYQKCAKEYFEESEASGKMKDPGVAELFWHLSRGDFPEVPDFVDCNVDSEAGELLRGSFYIFWSDHFFIQIPFAKEEKITIVPIHYLGPKIAYATIQEAAIHLIQNKNHYSTDILLLEI